MQANKTVTINGRVYDAVTGLPVAEKKTATPKKPTAKPAARRASHVAATAVHTAPERSHTLHRRSTKRPGPPKRPRPGTHMDIARAASVSRFAKHPVTAPAPKKEAKPDLAPKNHPVAARAAKKPAPAPAPTSRQVKEAAISAALAKPSPKPVKERGGWRWSRRFTIVTACFVVLILGALLTYMNLPSLSVGFASAQAGIEASYPEYRPDGFRLEQPVTFGEGEVTLTFVSNSGSGEYTITQTKSSWDSTAVLDNVVKKAAGDNYVTTQERGLTIYSYDDTATWVNAGILYTIKTSAPLSGEQIRHIATSL